MDREKIEKRLNELADLLNKTDPGSAEAEKILKEYLKELAIWKMCLEDERVLNERMDRNRRYDLDEAKYNAERIEARQKDMAIKLECATKIVDRLIMIFGVGALMLLVLYIQEKGLIESKMWALILKVLKI